MIKILGTQGLLLKAANKTGRSSCIPYERLFARANYKFTRRITSVESWLDRAQLEWPLAGRPHTS